MFLCWLATYFFPCTAFFGVCKQACMEAEEEGKPVSRAIARVLNPRKENKQG